MSSSGGPSSSRDYCYYEAQCKEIDEWQKKLGIPGSYETAGLVRAIVALKDRRIQELERTLESLRGSVSDMMHDLEMDNED